jgi:multiple sugar transport system ATP-binding protein
VIGNDFTIPVPQSKLDHIGGHAGKSVYFGIRPEDVHDAHYVPRGVDDATKIPAQVNLTEAMGSEVYAYIENGGKEFIGRLDPRTSARTGHGLDIVLDLEKMHIFDRETEKALV